MPAAKPYYIRSEDNTILFLLSDFRFLEMEPCIQYKKTKRISLADVQRGDKLLNK